MNWYYHDGKNSVGPITQEQFDQLVASGTIQGATLIWNESMPNWISYSEHRLGPQVTPGPVPSPSLATEPQVQERTVEYAGFWVRVVAKIIDGILLSFIGMAFSMMMGKGAIPDFEELNNQSSAGVYFDPASTLIQVAGQLAFVTFFLGRFGATPGKMVLGLRVVQSTGEGLRYPRALGRAAAELLSYAICLIGYIMVAFDSEKRGLHDHICSTRVIKK